MKRPDLEKLSKEQLAYVEYLEGCLSGSSELILALNTASRVFADDLNIMCNGFEPEQSALTFLTSDAKDKTFERIMVLFDKFDKIKALSQHFKGVATPQANTKVKLKPGGNIYEHVLDEVKNGRSRV